MNDYITPDEAMRELNLTESELVRLVAGRDLTALHEGNCTKFRRDEVARLKGFLSLP